MFKSAECRKEAAFCLGSFGPTWSQVPISAVRGEKFWRRQMEKCLGFLDIKG